MKLRRSARKHQAGVDPTIWWEFKPGEKVLTTEGLLGRVVDVEDGPYPGSEHYIVELDMDLGGGEYTSSELSYPEQAMASKTALAPQNKQNVMDQEVQSLLQQYGHEGWGKSLSEWTINLGDTQKARSAGETNFPNTTITIADWHIEQASTEKIIDTIRHEFAHAIAGPSAGHGFKWQMRARELGADPSATYKDQTDSFTDPGYKWYGVCPEHGAVSGWFRKPSVEWGCGIDRKPLLITDDWDEAYEFGYAASKTAEFNFIPGGKITEEQVKTIPLWMAEGGLADTEDDAERERIKIDIENIKNFQREGSRKTATGGTLWAGHRYDQEVYVSDPTELSGYREHGGVRATFMTRGQHGSGSYTTFSDLESAIEYLTAEGFEPYDKYASKQASYGEKGIGSEKAVRFNNDATGNEIYWAIQDGLIEVGDEVMVSGHTDTTGIVEEVDPWDPDEIAIRGLHGPTQIDKFRVTGLPWIEKLSKLAGQYVVEDADTGDLVSGPFDEREQAESEEDYQEDNRPEDDNLITMRQGSGPIEEKVCPKCGDYVVANRYAHHQKTHRIQEKEDYREDSEWGLNDAGRQGTLRLSQRDPENPNEGLDLAEELAASQDFTHSGVVIKALDSGRVLLTQRTPYEGDPEGVYGRWEFPGGSVDDSGDPIASAIREFEEEAGLALPEGYYIDGAYASGDYLAVIILVPNEAWTAMATLLMHETEGVGWFAIDDIDGSELVREEMGSADWGMIREALKRQGSTGLDCRFIEKEPGQWYYELESGWGGEDYDSYGPFPSFKKAQEHLDRNHANPGGWSISKHPNHQHSGGTSTSDLSGFVDGKLVYLETWDCCGEPVKEASKIAKTAETWVEEVVDEVTCPECKGSGGFIVGMDGWVDCDVCLGDGFIEENDTVEVHDWTVGAKGIDEEGVEHYASDDYPELSEILVERPPLQGRIKVSRKENCPECGSDTVDFFDPSADEVASYCPQCEWEESVKMGRKQAVLQIREYNYRGEDGWLITGTDGRGRGGQKVFVPEEMGRDAAEGIREKMKAGEDWSYDDFKQAGFLDRVLSPVGDYMVQNQTFMPDTIEVVPAGKQWAVLGYDEHGARRVLGTERSKEKAEAFAQAIRENNSPSARAPEEKTLFRNTKKTAAPKVFNDVDDLGSGGGVVDEVANALDDIMDEDDDDVFEASLKNDWHFTASWGDIQEKASRIRSEGHVRVISASPAYIAGEVQGDTNIYQTVLHREGTSNRVALWECGCAWASYSWGRSGRWKKYEGRMCSHALALLYETQSRGWGGAEIAEDAQKPSWMSDPSITVQRPGDYKKPDYGNWRLDASKKNLHPVSTDSSLRVAPSYVLGMSNQPNLTLRGELKDEPEAALPETTGDEGEIDASDFTGEETDLADTSHEAPAAILEEDPDEVGEDVELPPVESRSWLMDGGSPSGSGGGDVSDSDIALAAKQALKEFSVDEQKALIMEGETEGVQARNLDKLEVSGTHYEALEMALSEEEESVDDDIWMLL